MLETESKHNFFRKARVTHLGNSKVIKHTVISNNLLRRNRHSYFKRWNIFLQNPNCLQKLRRLRNLVF